jgi:hypothetical protein
MGIWTEGDSYMDGAYGVRLAQILATKANLTLSDGSIGGAAFVEIVARIVADADQHSTDCLVIWDGSSNGMISVDQTLADIGLIAAAMGDRPWLLIMPGIPTVRDFEDPTWVTTLAGEMRDLAAEAAQIYGPNHIFDPWPALRALATTAEDHGDVVAGFLPRSLYIDTYHMNTMAMNAVADAIVGQVKAQASGHFIGGTVHADQIIGTSDGDIVWGWTGRDTLKGEDGNDRISGMTGNDFVFGGSGSDALFGGQGRDTLSGGAGNDVLNGGAGADVFVFTSDSGRDVIFGFQSAFDHIDLSAFDGQVVEQFTRSAGDILLLADAVWIDFDGNGRADVRIRTPGYHEADLII